MKTVIFMIFMLIAGAVPSAANYIGKTVEEGLRTEHTRLQQEAALSGFKIELVDYVRQLYDAKATTRITIANPKEDNSGNTDNEFVLELKHRISHIPQPFKQVIATVDSEFVISEEAAEVLVPLFKDQAPFTSHTLIFFDGHQEGTIFSPAASGPIAGAEQTNVEWQGLKGTAWQSTQFDQAKLNMNIPKLSFSSVEGNQPNTISITDMNYDADMVKGSSSMWGGTSQLNIGAMDVNFTDNKGTNITIKIDTVSAHVEQSEQDGLAQGTGVLKSKSIAFNEYSVTDVVYDVSVENLDIKALMGLQASIQEMANDTESTGDPIQPLLTHLPALFNAHPILKINDLSLNSPMGKFHLKMDLSSTGKWDDSILKNPAMIATMIKTNIDASVPRNAVVMALKEQTQKRIVAHAVANNIELSDEEFEKTVTQSVNQQLNAVIQMGYIKENEGQLEAKLQYNAGQIAINGIDASPLAGAMMQSN